MSTGWDAFPRDPRAPQVAGQRASDAERGVLLYLLAEAYADGRLDREEYDDRAAAAAVLKTLGEMPALVADLMPDRTPVVARPSGELRAQAERKYRQDRTEAVMGFLMPTVICWTIWFAVMTGGFPWPAFVMLGVGGNLIRVLMSRESMVESEVKRLERKQAKALAPKDERPALPEGRSSETD